MLNDYKHRPSMNTMMTQRCFTDLEWDYFEGHGDLASRFTIGIFGIIIWLIGVINLLTKSP